MLFSSIKEINTLIRMSNTYLKATIEKNWHSQNFQFDILKAPARPTSSCNLKIKGLGAKVCVAFLMF